MGLLQRKRPWSTVEATIDWRVLRPDGSGGLTWYDDDSFEFRPHRGGSVRFDHIDLVSWQLRLITVNATTFRYINLVGATGLLDATLKVAPKQEADRWIARLRVLDHILEDRPYDFGEQRFAD